MALGQLDERLYQFEIRDFSPGLFNSFTDIVIPPGGAELANNVRFDTVGGVKKRLNRAYYNTTSLGANPIMHAERIYIGSNAYQILIYDTILKVGDDTGGAPSNLKTGLTADLRYTGVTYKNQHYLFNGTDSNIVTDGTAANTTDSGISAPGAATVATGDPGVLTGDYYYKISYIIDGYQESTAGTASSKVTADSDKIDLSSIPVSTNPRCTDRYIYRTTAGGSTYYYLDNIGDNTTETYEDNTADGSLDTTIEAPTDNGTPPIGKYGILHKDRIFIAGNSTYPSRVYFSKIASSTSYPDIYPTNNWIDIAADDGDEITALAIDPTGALCVFKNNTIRKVYTDGDPTNWEVSEPFSFSGCVAPYSIAQSPYGIFYLARSDEYGKEIRLFDGQNSSPFSEKVAAEVDKITRTRIGEAVGHYHDNRYLLSYSDDSVGHTYNDRVLICDIKRKAFSIDVKNINCFCTWYGGDDGGQLHSGDSTIGRIYREDTENYDIIHDLKSELDGGTYSDTVSGGSETNPTVTLTGTLTDNQPANSAWEDLDGANNTWADYTDEVETWCPSGSLTSDTLEINAFNLNKIYWSESLGANGAVAFYVRTGASTVACEAASWSGPYTDPTGSDISGVTAAKYIQYKAILATNDTDVTATPNLYLNNGYVVKISADYGSAAETDIVFNYKLGWLDCGQSRMVKRFRGVRLEYDSGSSGTLTCYYAFDRGSEDSFSIDLSTYSDKYTANFDYDDLGELVQIRLHCDSTSTITIKRLVLLYSLKPYRWS